jgi:peptidoglycan/LPS O-acetylase OafA/YrhL
VLKPTKRPLADSHLPALTGVRFFLALWVILHHLTSRNMMLEGWARTLPEEVRNFIRGGYLAVGAFFVLSGFVLGRRYDAPRWTRTSLFNYGLSRFARIYPVYLVSLVLILPLVILDWKPAWMANYVFLLQGWSDPGVYWNTPAWSLSCEVFFYLLFPLAVLLFRARNWPGVLAVATAACLLTATLRNIGMPEAWKPLLHFSDFLIGVAAADAFALLPRWPRGKGAWLYLPACAASVAVIARPDILARGLTLNGTLRPLNAIALIGLALGGGALGRFLSHELTVYLGKASYSMYILHIPLLWYYNFPRDFNHLPAVVNACLYTLLVIAVSAAVFRWIEEPANSNLRKRFKARALAG